MIYRLLKRAFDAFCSGIILLVMAPVFLIIVIGIKLSSPGPVFYISERMGRKGRKFKMYKFRSMHIKAEGAVENKYLVNNDRIFPFGSFLRKSKLDEFPQMLNVFLGHMSFVGPRPYPKPAFDRLYSDASEKVLSVRPGLACLDSLYDYAHGDLFVSDAEMYKEKIMPVRTELAKLYIEKKSFKMDFHCIFRTVMLIFQIVVLKKKKFELTEFEKEAQNRVLRVQKNNSQKVEG
ncbi:MAG: sugar transferase [Ruminococcus sp.]|nr:sugar transferase [Ruminococcus sp.]MBQ7027953.1 sugar transferase [Ruminococcus sp.]